ncbi:MAG: DeoR/GlpR family DNA-binding transcription regulator [Firmicutes bacterium]|nr:DeoR/GlpR family DNA-binding transcription regulator [Bacillota bacterium]
MNPAPIFAEERKDKILSILEKQLKVTVPELSRIFGVSEVTIRKDLKTLENAGTLKRTHGGAISIHGTRFELSTREKVVKNHEQKARIGKYAASLVTEGDSVILDSGTTTLEIARNLSDKKNVTVVVNDLNIASALEPVHGVDVIVLGGTLRKGVASLVGPITEDALGRFYVDKLFLATNGIDVDRGVTTPDVIHAETKRKMTHVARQVIVVADSTKIGKASFVSVAPLSRVDMIITDDGARAESIREFEDRGVRVVIV